jgi:hypothetical protein
MKFSPCNDGVGRLVVQLHPFLTSSLRKSEWLDQMYTLEALRPLKQPPDTHCMHCAKVVESRKISFTGMGWGGTIF